MTTEKEVYLLVLYEKKGQEPPKFIGFKTLKLEEYNLLTKRFSPTIEVLGKSWGILERHWFTHTLLEQNTHYIIVDAEKI